jgi:hypothetical protein
VFVRYQQCFHESLIQVAVQCTEVLPPLIVSACISRECDMEAHSPGLRALIEIPASSVQGNATLPTKRPPRCMPACISGRHINAQDGVIEEAASKAVPAFTLRSLEAPGNIRPRADAPRSTTMPFWLGAATTAAHPVPSQAPAIRPARAK